MSRIYPNGFSPWASGTGSSMHNKAMNIQADNSTGDVPPSGRNLWDRNTWDVQRLMELDRSTNWQEQWNPRMSMSFNNTKGLLNAPGDNNCFLNSAVQVLWHLDVFRRSFRMLSGHSCLGSNSCIFCALKVIFTQFQYSDQSCLPPDALRKALAKTFADQQRFQLGLMDDAAECFENILTQIHFHIANGESEDMCNAKHCISHQKFAMTVIEQIVCPCEATSEPLPFSQMVHYVSTSTLVSQAKIANGAATFGQLLKGAISEGDYRNCPSNCGRKVQLRRTLLNSPDVVSVGLVWDSENPSSQHIHDVVWSIGTTLQLKDLFHDVVDVRCKQGSKLYLVGVVCYYGKHYSTFFYHSKMKSWVSFDDANVKEMGSDWSAIVDKCCRGHYQPLLLLYANPDAEVINVKTAPQKTVIVKEMAFLSNVDENSSGPTGSYHCRQRSCDSLSGTIGGQCVDDSYTENIRMKRSVTPNPDSGKEKVTALPRRAITPGPEWGHYDSDDDSRTSTVVHQRQSSYLNALDCVDSSDVWKAPLSGVRSLAGKTPDYRHPDLKTAKPVDAKSSGSQYHERSCYHQTPGSSAYQNRCHTAPCDGQNGYSGDCVSQSQGSSTAVYGSVCSGSTITSVAGSATTYQVAASHNGTNTHYLSASHGTSYPSGQQAVQTSHHSNHQQSVLTSHYSNCQQQSVPKPHYPNGQQSISTSHSSNGQQYISPSQYHNGQQFVPVSHYSGSQQSDSVSSQRMNYGNSAQAVPNVCNTNNRQALPLSATSHKLPQSAPSTPGMKRAQFVENSDSLLGRGPNSRPTVSRSRPSSARPYDYGHSRPTVDPKTGAVIMPTHQQPPPVSGALSEWNEAVLIGDFTTPDSCELKQTSANKTLNSSRYGAVQNDDVDDGYGTYINPKTVQNVLNIQKSKNSKTGANKSIKMVPVNGNSHTSELADQKNPRVSLHNQALLADLKVDIPGDNISLGSHKDSGYRSGGSSGDRNSASSASSISFDSPTADNFRGFAGIHRPLVHTYNSSSHSSSESLSSTQSGQTVKNLPNNRLSLIPENTLSSSSSSLTMSGGKSQESLNNSQDYVDGYVSDRSLDHSKVSDRWDSRKQKVKDTGGFVGANTNYGPEAECQKLFLQAEAMLELSSKQEHSKDIHAALAYCNQAVGYLQKALSIPGISNDTTVHVRMKHNACVLRSRKLQKQIMLQQQSNEPSSCGMLKQLMESNKSTPFQSSTSIPRFSHETFSRSDVNQQISETAPGKEHVTVQERTAGLYQPVPQSCSNQNVAFSRNSNHVGNHMIAVSGIAQSRPVQGVTMGHANIPRSLTDSALTQSSLHQNREVYREHPSRQMDLPTPTIVNSDNLDSKDARYVEIYGTLPKRKGKRSKSPQNPIVSDHQSQDGQFHDHMNKQDSSSCDSNRANGRVSEECRVENQSRMALINHSRQWSKDELRDILLKDFMNRPKASDDHNKNANQGTPLQRRNSYDPLENTRHGVRELPSHSRQNSHEDFLSKQMTTVSMTDQYPDLPPKQKNANQKPSAHLPIKRTQEESHYDYLPLRSKPNQSISSRIPSSMVSSVCNSRLSSGSQLPLCATSGLSSSSSMSSVSELPFTHGSGMVASSSTGMSSGSNLGISSGPGMCKNPDSGLSSSGSSGMTIVGITGIPNRKPSCTSPQLGNRQANQDPVWKNAVCDPYSSKRELPTVPKQSLKDWTENEQKRFYPKPSAVKNRDTSKIPNYVKSYEIQRPGEQGRAAIAETVPIKVNKPDTPPKPAQKSMKSVKPEVPKRKSSQLSTFKGDTIDPSNSLHTHGPPNPMYKRIGVPPTASSAPPPYVPPPSVATPDCDLPPPPAELLYPPLEDGIPRNVALNQHGITTTEQHTSADKHQPDVYHDADYEKCGSALMTENRSDGNGVAPAVPQPSPTKPTLSKPKNATKPRKSVTFNENIALIATQEEVPQEIDYVAYVMNLGKNKCLKQNGASIVDGENYKDGEDEEEEEDDDNTSDSMDSDAVLCNLCRKKKIHPPEIYCEHCCFYMSQFQPQAS